MFWMFGWLGFIYFLFCDSFVLVSFSFYNPKSNGIIIWHGRPRNSKSYKRIFVTKGWRWERRRRQGRIHKTKKENRYWDTSKVQKQMKERVVVVIIVIVVVNIVTSIHSNTKHQEKKNTHTHARNNYHSKSNKTQQQPKLTAISIHPDRTPCYFLVL